MIEKIGYSWTEGKIKKLGGSTVLRKKDGQIFYTDNGNYIVDVSFEPGTVLLERSENLERQVILHGARGKD